MNETIRRTARANGVPFWKICDELHVSEPTFTRLMRKPLDKEKERLILGIIAKVASREDGQ